MPSVEVITLVVPVVPAAATNNPNSALHVTAFQIRTAGAVRPVHVMPSGDVMMRVGSPVVKLPDCATATNSPNVADHVMSCQSPMMALVRAVHVIPSGEVITCCVITEPSDSNWPVDTAANNPSEGEYATDDHEYARAAARVVHVTPSGDVRTRFTLPPAPVFPDRSPTETNNPSSSTQMVFRMPSASDVVTSDHVIAMIRRSGRARSRRNACLWWRDWRAARRRRPARDRVRRPCSLQHSRDD